MPARRLVEGEAEHRRRSSKPADAWKMRRANAPIRREDDRALDPVLQLAHVAGPCVAAQDGARVVRERRRGTPVPLRVQLGEMRRELEELFLPALAERGNLDLDDADPVVEVLPERALGDARLEVLVRRADDADVGVQGLPPTDALEGAILEKPQELSLNLRWEVADLVEKERAALGELDAPWHALVGAGERAALVAEELALDELRRERRAIDGDERPFWRSEFT